MRSGPANFAPLFRYGNLEPGGTPPEATDLNDTPEGWCIYGGLAANSPGGSGRVFTQTIGSSVYQNAMQDSSNGLPGIIRNNFLGVWGAWNAAANIGGSSSWTFSVAPATIGQNAIRLDRVSGREAVITVNGTFTPTYTGQYLARTIGGGGGSGGAAGNAAGGSSMGGKPGAGGELNFSLLTLTGGDVYTAAIGAGGVAGAGGAATPAGGAQGGKGGETTFSDAAANVLASANGGAGGYGDSDTSAASLNEIGRAHV